MKSIANLSLAMIALQISYAAFHLKSELEFPKLELPNQPRFNNPMWQQIKLRN